MWEERKRREGGMRRRRGGGRRGAWAVWAAAHPPTFFRCSVHRQRQACHSGGIKMKITLPSLLAAPRLGTCSGSISTLMGRSVNSPSNSNCIRCIDEAPTVTCSYSQVCCFPLGCSAATDTARQRPDGTLQGLGPVKSVFLLALLGRETMPALSFLQE